MASSVEGVEKVVIIGSGPAGWSAAIYAARANLKPLVYEGTAKPEMIPLGQLAFTTEVENYPGFPKKIGGQELMAAFREQSIHQGVDIRTEDVNKVDFSKRPFRVWAGDDNAEWTSETIIIATGAQAKWLVYKAEIFPVP